MTTIWNTLGIERTADERSIKRAYAKQLKQNRPEDDPEGFQALRDAYETALRHCRFEAADAVEDAIGMVEGDTPAGAGAAVDSDGEASVQAPAQRAAIPAKPSASERTDALQRAWNEAQLQWSDFLQRSSVSPRVELDRQLRGEALQNLATRDAFELIAARHCGGVDCPADLRGAIVAYFEWERDASQLARMDAQAAHDAVGRARADTQHIQLCGASSSSKAARCLLADKPPSFSLRHWDARFTKAMRELIATIRWRTPEILHYRLNQDVFAWWEARVQAKHYFWQTAALSLLAGIALYLALVFSTWATSDGAILACFVSAMLLSVGGTALYKVKAAGTLKPALLEFRYRHYERHLHDGAYHQLKYGWLLAFVPLTLLMFAPQPGMLLQGAVTLGLLLCCGAALLGAAPNLLPRGYIVILVVGLLLGWGVHTALPGFGWPAAMLTGICIEILAVNCDERLADLQTYAGSTRLTQIMMLWLAGFAALIFCCYTPVLPALVLAMAVWIWVLVGVVLTSFSVSGPIFWAMLLSARFASAFKGNQPWQAEQLAVFTPLLLLIATFMLYSMYRAANNQGYYSS